MENCKHIDAIHATDNCDCAPKARELERAIKLLEEAILARIEAQSYRLWRESDYLHFDRYIKMSKKKVGY